MNYWWGFFSDSFCRLNGYASRWWRGTLYDWVIDSVISRSLIHSRTKHMICIIILHLLNHNNITKTICVKSMSGFTCIHKIVGDFWWDSEVLIHWTLCYPMRPWERSCEWLWRKCNRRCKSHDNYCKVLHLYNIEYTYEYGCKEVTSKEVTQRVHNFEHMQPVCCSKTQHWFSFDSVHTCNTVVSPAFESLKG